jgi:hypothetical protein
MKRRWVMLLVLVIGLCGSAGRLYAWRGHGFGGGGVGIGISIGPFWVPDAAPVVVPPPAAVIPDPSVVRPPTGPPSWYSCDNPLGYYPYVSQCPRGWRAVSPTPTPQQ